MFSRYSVIRRILPPKAAKIFEPMSRPLHSISEALLAKITEALLENYRTKFNSQSATDEYCHKKCMNIVTENNMAHRIHKYGHRECMNIVTDSA